MKTVVLLLHVLILLLVLLLLALGPVSAEEIITPLGDRWYAVANPEAVVIPESGVTPLIVICLDEVPGGLDSTPNIRVEPLRKGQGNKRTVTVMREGFFPIPDARFMAYASFVLKGIPGVAYDVSVIIRGKQ